MSILSFMLKYGHVKTLLVDAVMGIKSTYDVKKNWDGDPCVPVQYLWTGLNCSNDVLTPPRIISL